VPITKPMPIYDALLALATADEREAIINGGPKEHLYHVLAFGSPKESDAASAAYAAIKAVLSRIGADPHLLIRGIDSRMMPPKREIVDAEVVLTGRLMFEGDGIEGKVQLEWLNPPIYIVGLRIEPVEQPLAVPLVMKPSDRLPPGEVKDDTARLHRMQVELDNGLPPKAAARAAARAMPDPPTSEESLTSRLVRRFKKRQAR
jgi:hypothetical protein